MVLYHGTDSSSKHHKVHLHNLSIRCKASGLRDDSGDRYFAAGIDRTLNGGLTQCANSGNIFHSSPHYPVAHLFQRHSQETGALCRGLEWVSKGQSIWICSSCLAGILTELCVAVLIQAPSRSVKTPSWTVACVFKDQNEFKATAI